MNFDSVEMRYFVCFLDVFLDNKEVMIDFMK